MQRKKNLKIIFFAKISSEKSGSGCSSDYLQGKVKLCLCLLHLQFEEGLHFHVEEAKWHVAPFITSTTCLPTGCQQNPFKGVASFALTWVYNEQKTGGQWSLSLCSKHHEIRLQMAPFVMAHGKNCDFQGMFCRTGDFWSLCSKWWGWQPCLAECGQGKEQYLNCLCKFALWQTLIVLTHTQEDEQDQN